MRLNIDVELDTKQVAEAMEREWSMQELHDFILMMDEEYSSVENSLRLVKKLLRSLKSDVPEVGPALDTINKLVKEKENANGNSPKN